MHSYPAASSVKPDFKSILERVKREPVVTFSTIAGQPEHDRLVIYSDDVKNDLREVIEVNFSRLALESRFLSGFDPVKNVWKEYGPTRHSRIESKRGEKNLREWISMRSEQLTGWKKASWTSYELMKPNPPRSSSDSVRLKIFRESLNPAHIKGLAGAGYSKATIRDLYVSKAEFKTRLYSGNVRSRVADFVAVTDDATAAKKLKPADASTVIRWLVSTGYVRHVAGIHAY